MHSAPLFLLFLLSLFNFMPIKSLKFYNSLPWEKWLWKSKLPVGKYFSNVRKMSNFFGVKNLHFSSQKESPKLYLESKIIFGYKYGCNQLYSLDLNLTNKMNELEQQFFPPPQRISSGHVDVENVVFLNNQEDLALVASNNKLMDKLLNYSIEEGENDLELLTLINKKECQEPTTSPLIEFFKENCQNYRTWKHSEEAIESICKFWWMQESIFAYSELFVALNPNNDIYIYNVTSQWPLKKLTSNPNFDGFPCLSEDGKTIYYISIDNSITDGIPQIWSMDSDTGENKTQLTFSNNWKVGKLELSPNGTHLALMCIPNGNGIHEELQHLLSNQPATYNISASKICIVSLENGQEKFNDMIIEFSNATTIESSLALSVAELYQFSNPIFLSDQKIIFSARKFIPPESDTMDHYTNMALFMSNLDGTDLEQIVDYRGMNDFPALNIDGRSIAWISTEGINSLRQQQYIHMAEFSNLTVDTFLNIELLNIKITNVERLTNFVANQHAMRPIFSADHESILFELIKIPTSPKNASSNKIPEISSEIRRLPIQINKILANKNAKNYCSKNVDKAASEYQHFSLSSPLEFASNVANFDSGENFIIYSMGSKYSKRNKEIGQNLIWANWKEDKIPILESRQYLGENLQTNVYKSNGLGQILYPLVEEANDEFASIIEAAVHMHNDSFCQLLFISTKKNSNSSTGRPLYELWTILSDNCWNDDDEVFCHYPQSGGINISSNTQNYDDANADGRCSKWHKRKAGKPVQSGMMNKMRKLLGDGDEHSEAKFSYIAEATFSSDGQKIVFVGSLALDAADNQQRRYANNGAHFDGQITELFILNSDGTGLSKLTNFKAQSFGPKFLPAPFSSELIIFSSNYFIASVDASSSTTTTAKKTSSSLYMMNSMTKQFKQIQISTGSHLHQKFFNFMHVDVINANKDNRAASMEMVITWSGTMEADCPDKNSTEKNYNIGKDDDDDYKMLEQPRKQQNDLFVGILSFENNEKN